jgi:DNA polymerase alpha-associated DNA helicase A
VCWIPIFKAKKLILAGDPMQLPPTILSNVRKQKNKDTVKSIPNTQPKTKLKAEEKTSTQADRVQSSLDKQSASDPESSFPDLSEELEEIKDAVASVPMKPVVKEPKYKYSFTPTAYTRDHHVRPSRENVRSQHQKDAQRPVSGSLFSSIL